MSEEYGEEGGWDATHEAAAAAAAAHAAAHAAAVGHIPEGHHDGHSTADPVLAAATAAAMDAAGDAAAPDESATEAAVAVAAVLPEGEVAEAEDVEEVHHMTMSGTKTRKSFDDRLKELRKFKMKHGHCNVPHKYTLNPQLGTWVDTQRRLYRSNKRDPAKPTTLTPENIQKLIDCGFIFEPRPSREQTWNNRLAELAQYKARHGHCNVREDDQTYPGLGKWVSYIRRQYRLIRQGRRAKDTKRLSPQRLEQLREIGFVFELREEMAHKRFREGIAALRIFVEENGHADVPNFYDKNPTLGLVMEEMKREASKLQNGQPSTMSQDMLSELVSLGVASNTGAAVEQRHDLQPADLHQHQHDVPPGDEAAAAAVVMPGAEHEEHHEENGPETPHVEL